MSEKITITKEKNKMKHILIDEIVCCCDECPLYCRGDNFDIICVINTEVYASDTKALFKQCPFSDIEKIKTEKEQDTIDISFKDIDLWLDNKDKTNERTEK